MDSMSTIIAIIILLGVFLKISLVHKHYLYEMDLTT